MAGYHAAVTVRACDAAFRAVSRCGTIAGMRRADSLGWRGNAAVDFVAVSESWQSVVRTSYYYLVGYTSHADWLRRKRNRAVDDRGAIASSRSMAPEHEHVARIDARCLSCAYKIVWVRCSSRAPSVTLFLTSVIRSEGSVSGQGGAAQGGPL